MRLLLTALLTVALFPHDAGSVPIKFFEPGWEAVSYQTYVSPCEPDYVLPHRLDHGAQFIYVQDTCRSTTVADWVDFIGRLPDGAIVAPLAEANGTWVTWHRPPELHIREYEAIRSIDVEHRLTWCFAPNAAWRGQPYHWWEYLPDRASYDLLCPSIYAHHGESGESIARRAHMMGLVADADVILAQTGYAGPDQWAWLEDLTVSRFDNLIEVVYFNQDDAQEWALPERQG